MEEKSILYKLTDEYLERIGGQLTEETMDMLTAEEHTLLAYRILRDEVMEGGFIQLIQNGWGPYVLAGPFPMMMKTQWGLTEFGKFMYEVRKEYLRHKDELEAEMDDDAFMALYEQYEQMNEYGDDFLDEWEEVVTPEIERICEELKNKRSLSPRNLLLVGTP